MATKTLSVGIVGAGDVAQVVHLPTLQLLSHLYKVRAICDVSLKTANHCASKFGIPIATTNADDLFQDKSIDLIFILTSDEYHEPYTIAALHAGKTVMLEKPITLSLQSGKRIIAAQPNAPNGARVFVGYMRRYAPSLAAFKREISTIESIRYVRVRDIIGPNSFFINQSGCFSRKYVDDILSSAGSDRQDRIAKLLEEAWGTPFAEQSSAQMDYCCMHATLGSHGLSLMRDVLAGLPEQVLASAHNGRWYTTMFEYLNRKDPFDPFTCMFEMGIDSVPRFDSGVTVYGENKTVSINYDTPFVKGLGITVEIDEMNEFGEKTHRSLQTSYEDAYTAELKELYECVVEGKPFKTTAEDAMEDLKLVKMMLDKYPEHKKRKADTGTTSTFVPAQP